MQCLLDYDEGNVQGCKEMPEEMVGVVLSFVQKWWCKEQEEKER
jgi:hypothetical protein